MYSRIKKYSISLLFCLICIAHLYSQGVKVDHTSISAPIADTMVNQYLNRSKLYLKNGNIDSLASVLNAVSYHVERGTLDAAQLYVYYLVNSKYYGINDDLVPALKNLIEAKKTINSSQVIRLAKINENIASIYYRLFDYASCLEIYESNLALLKNNGSKLELLFVYYGIADCHIQLGNPDYAKKICFEALDLSQQSGVSESLGFIYNLLGRIYIIQSKIDSAEYFVEKGIAISKKQNDIKELYDNYSCMVELQLIRGDINKAQTYAELAINNPMEHNPTVYNSLALIYSKQQKFRKSNEILEKNVDYYVNKLDNNYSKVATSLLKNRYEQEKLYELTRREQKDQRTKLQIIVGSLLFILLGTLSVIANQIQNKRKIKNINNVLIEKNKNLQDFAFICSHDFKEPIRNIGSFSRLIQYKVSKENTKLNYDTYFKTINDGIKVLNKIVNSLGIYTELNQDKVLPKSLLYIDPLFERIVTNVSSDIDRKNVEITLNNKIEKKEIYSSEYGVEVLLRNLILNAIVHNPSKNPKVEINAIDQKNNILITVKDNGPGIPKEYYNEIFLPLKTLKNKSLTSSSGLGLAICNLVINNIGGEIWVESEIGKGSTFSILIYQ